MGDPNTHPHVTVAAALTAALERGDLPAIEALYDESIAVFRNFDGKTLSRAKVLKVVGFLTSAVDGLRYQDVRVEPTPSGFVQRHTFTGTSKAGVPFSAHVCLVAEVRDGRIVRIDEYLDPAALAPIMGG